MSCTWCTSRTETVAVSSLDKFVNCIVGIVRISQIHHATFCILASFWHSSRGCHEIVVVFRTQ